MMRILRPVRLAGLAILGFAAFSASAEAAPSCDGGSIKLGAISTITGASDFSETPKATKAMFDGINAKGGIHGCKIDYTIADDKGDPQVANQAARDLIDNTGIAAMVGGASFLDCAVNSPTYKRKGVLAVQGLGIDPVCFHSPVVAPVNVGPYTLTTVMGYYATTVLKAKNLCAFFIIIGGTQDAYKAAITRWEKITGQKIHMMDLTLPAQGDLTPYVIKARDSGCDAVISNAVEPGVVQWVKTAEAQKIKGINWLFLSPAYTEGVRKSLAGTDQPIYAGTEWEPYTVDSKANAEWIASMKEAGLPLTAFSQGGYLAAKVISDVIAGMDGPVNRETLSNALLTMKPKSYPIAGSQYVFGKAKVHSPMQATKVMRLDHGKWVEETKDWVKLPEAN